MLRAVISAAVLTVAVSLAPPATADDAPNATRIAFKVVCSDKSVADRLNKDIGDILRGRPGYKLVETTPAAELIVYANQDVNDRKNPNGFSIAIAQVRNGQTYRLAAKFLGPTPTNDAEVKSLLTSMLGEEGFLYYLNVAHMDEATDQSIMEISQAATAAFFQRVLASAGG